MAKPLETIVELTDVLTQLESARRSLEDVPDSMKELQAQYQERKALIDALAEKQSAAELARRADEGAAEECQTQLDHYQSQISQVTTQREHGALLSEIDNARKAKVTHEEAAIAALEVIEASKTEHEAAVAEFSQLDGEYKEQMSTWEADKPAVKKTIKNLETESEVLKGKLDKPLQRQFERLFERHKGAPLAEVQRVELPGKKKAKGKMYRCSTCNYEIRPQVVVEIRNHGELKSCEYCQRILHLVAEETDGAAADS